MHYLGTEAPTIVIEKKEDLYPLLDHFHTELMELGYDEETTKYISELMDKVEKDGFGSYDDVENVEHG